MKLASTRRQDLPYRAAAGVGEWELPLPSFPSPAGEGGAKRRMGWGRCYAPIGLRQRDRELAVRSRGFPHPIRRLRRHLPRFAKKGPARNDGRNYDLP